jgi:hypothetical protein
MVAAMVGSGSILEEVNGSNMRQREKRKAAAALQGPQSQQKPLIVNTRKNLHLVRKLFHALAGIAIAGVYEYALDRERCLFVFGVLFVALGIGECVRLLLPNWYLSKLSLKVMRVFARTYEVIYPLQDIFFALDLDSQPTCSNGHTPRNPACELTWNWLGQVKHASGMVFFLAGVLICISVYPFPVFLIA